MTTTKIYRNDSDKTVNVIGVGEIEPGNQVSITSEYHQPVVLSNYPGVVEVSDEVQTAEPEAPASSEETHNENL